MKQRTHVQQLPITDHEALKSLKKMKEIAFVFFFLQKGGHFKYRELFFSLFNFTKYGTEKKLNNETFRW